MVLCAVEIELFSGPAMRLSLLNRENTRIFCRCNGTTAGKYRKTSGC